MKNYIVLLSLFFMSFASHGGFISSNGMSIPAGLICDDGNGIELHLMPNQPAVWYHDLFFVIHGERQAPLATHLACQADGPRSNRHVLENDCYTHPGQKTGFQIISVIKDRKLVLSTFDYEKSEPHQYEFLLSQCRIQPIKL